MPGTGKIHGKDGAITVGGSRVSNKTEWTLQRNRDYVDATTFGDTNKTYLVGLPNVQGTYAGLLDITGDTLLDAATQEALEVGLYASYSGLNGIVQVAHGPAFVDANVNCTNTDAVRITGEFRASDAWSIDL
jgi:hypothetical protein